MARWSTVGVTMVQVESRKWCNCDCDGSCCGQSEAALPPRRGAQAMANSGSARAALRAVLLDLALDAGGRADLSWRRHKAPMAAYWKAVAVYARHLARVLR